MFLLSERLLPAVAKEPKSGSHDTKTVLGGLAFLCDFVPLVRKLVSTM